MHLNLPGKLLENASLLKDTGFSVTKQIPPQVEEQKQFAWGEFRKARNDGKQAKFDVQKLYIDNELQQKLEPFLLPSQVSSVVPPLVGRSNKITDGTHEFSGYAIEMQSIQDVRNGLDYLLKHETSRMLIIFHTLLGHLTPAQVQDCSKTSIQTEIQELGWWFWNHYRQINLWTWPALWHILGLGILHIRRKLNA